MNPYQGRRLGPAGSPQSLRLVMITIIVWSLLCAANVCILASPACRTSLSPEVQEHVAVLSMLGRLSAVMEREGWDLQRTNARSPGTDLVVGLSSGPDRPDAPHFSFRRDGEDYSLPGNSPHCENLHRRSTAQFERSHI